jgi:hypothetical protein
MMRGVDVMHVKLLMIVPEKSHDVTYLTVCVDPRLVRLDVIRKVNMRHDSHERSLTDQLFFILQWIIILFISLFACYYRCTSRESDHDSCNLQ